MVCEPQKMASNERSEPAGKSSPQNATKSAAKHVAQQAVGANSCLKRKVEKLRTSIRGVGGFSLKSWRARLAPPRMQTTRTHSYLQFARVIYYK